MSETIQDAQTPAPETTEAPQGNRFVELAAQRFGSKFVGDVPETPPEPPAEEVESEGRQQEIVQEEPAEDVEAAESEAAEAFEEAGEAEEVAIESFAELVESQGWDPEWANSLQVTTKVDGREETRSIADLIAVGQTMEAAQNRLEEGKAIQAAAKEAAKQEREAAQQQMAVLGGLVTEIENQIKGEFSGVDWAKLEHDDPAEYSRLRLRAQDRLQSLGTIKTQALEQYKQSLAKQQSEEKARQQEQLQTEQAALLKALPEWSDPEVAKAEQTALVGYLTGMGFSEQDVMAASDHRLILLARDAMKYHENRNAANVAAKKVVKVPKVVKPGAPKSADQRTTERTDEALRKLQRSGTKADAIAYLRAKKRAAKS